MSIQAAKGRAVQQRLDRLRKAQANLYWLAKEILGYDKLTEEFHRPMLDDMDRQRREGVKRTLELWPRGHYKTTIRIAQIVQDILIDPNVTIFVCHAVEDEVNKMVQEAGNHFLRNKVLRELRPEIMPRPQDKRFCKSNQFTVRRTIYSRQPTVLGKSSQAEITGAHCGIIYPDDIVGRNTIADSQLPNVKSWLRNTMMPVLNPGGTIRATGTRWDIDDPYAMWLDSNLWECRVRAALETDGKPDYKGSPVLFSASELRLRRKEMGESDFAFQMMNDPSPTGEKPWNPGQCEHYCGIQGSKEAPGAAGQGTVFVLSDPAPAKEGSFSGEGEKKRGDGTKDDWAFSVVKFKVHQGMQLCVLLDLSTSKVWTRGAGLDEACRLMKKWGTNKFFNEAYGGMIADYTEDMKKAARRNGTPLYLAKDGQLPKFKNSYAKGSKNNRFGALADWASTGRFVICKETVPEKELEKFLQQARNWIPLPTGRNTLRYDDVADVVARSTDAALQGFAPQTITTTFEDMFAAEETEDPSYQPMSRYCGI